MYTVICPQGVVHITAAMHSPPSISYLGEVKGVPPEVLRLFKGHYLDVQGPGGLGWRKREGGKKGGGRGWRDLVSYSPQEDKHTTHMYP